MADRVFGVGKLFFLLLWIFCENLLEWSGKERKGKGGGKMGREDDTYERKASGLSLCRPFCNILHSIYSHSIPRLKHIRVDSSIPYILALYFSHTHHWIVSILDCVPESLASAPFLSPQLCPSPRLSVSTAATERQQADRPLLVKIDTFRNGGSVRAEETVEELQRIPGDQEEVTPGKLGELEPGQQRQHGVR